MATEKRLIDANALCQSIVFAEFDTLADRIFINEMLRSAPTVYAVEVVHGRWLQSEPGYRLCSHCLADVAIYSGHINYCPNCGADMRGSEE